MRSLIDNTRRKPYATLNLRGGGSIQLRPALIQEAKDCGGKYTKVKYGATWIEVKEKAEEVMHLAKLSKDMEEKANQ